MSEVVIKQLLPLEVAHATPLPLYRSQQSQYVSHSDDLSTIYYGNPCSLQNKPDSIKKMLIFLKASYLMHV